MAFTFSKQQQQLRKVVEGIGSGENWLPAYLDKKYYKLEKYPLARASFLRFYNLGDKAELPFYISCFLLEINPDVA